MKKNKSLYPATLSLLLLTSFFSVAGYAGMLSCAEIKSLLGDMAIPGGECEEYHKSSKSLKTETSNNKKKTTHYSSQSEITEAKSFSLTEPKTTDISPLINKSGSMIIDFTDGSYNSGKSIDIEFISDPNHELITYSFFITESQRQLTTIKLSSPEKQVKDTVPANRLLKNNPSLVFKWSGENNNKQFKVFSGNEELASTKVPFYFSIKKIRFKGDDVKADVKITSNNQ